MNQNFYDKLKNALCNSDIDFLRTHRDKYDINHCFADEDNDSLLLYAMSDKGSSAYKYLLENGADIGHINAIGEGIWHSVAFCDEVSRVELLLSLYPHSLHSINHQNKEGLTPLHYAIMFGNVNVAMRYVDIGADVFVADSEGCEALHFACLFVFANHIDNLRLTKKLIGKGSNPLSKTKKGNYPLALAINNDLIEVVKYLYAIVYG